MKRGLLVLFLGILLIGIVCGASGTESNFTISGCTLGEIGLATDSCSPDGNYFCNYENGEYDLLDTVNDNFGCSLGSSTYTLGQPFCCPAGYFCDDGAGPICNLRMGECSDQLTQGDCENLGCYWIIIDGEGVCTEFYSDYSCEIYEDSATCLEDQFRLGQIGIGTEVCGTYFSVDTIGYVIPLESCRCEWTTSCMLAYNVLEEFTDGTANTFECIKDYTTGDCINGTQHIAWSATPKILSGYLPPEFLSGVPTPVLVAAKCVSNAIGGERDCGLPTLKLFGFGLFSFFMSLGIIGLFYFIQELKSQKSKLKKHL